MHLIEAYSHYCGVEPGKPFVWEKYFSIPFERYVVIQAGTGMESKQYDYWEYVAENIKFPIVQIGGEKDEPLPSTLDLRGKTSWNESAYILRRAALFLGCDSVGNHMASAFGVPRIALFGATSPISCGGYWKSNLKSFELCPPDMRGCAAPCFHDKCIRGNKCINSIRPEAILDKAASILGKEAVEEVKFVYFGSKAKETILEWIPITLEQDDFARLRMLSGIIHVRLDLVNDIDVVKFSQLAKSISAKLNIFALPGVASKLKIGRERVLSINIMGNTANIDEAIKEAKLLHNSMVPVTILVDNHEKFNDRKIEVLDFTTFVSFSDSIAIPTELASIKDGCYTVSSARRILGALGKVYMTRFDALNDTNRVDVFPIPFTLNLTKQQLQEAHRLVIRKYASKI